VPAAKTARVLQERQINELNYRHKCNCYPLHSLWTAVFLLDKLDGAACNPPRAAAAVGWQSCPKLQAQPGRSWSALGGARGAGGCLAAAASPGTSSRPALLTEARLMEMLMGKAGIGKAGAQTGAGAGANVFACGLVPGRTAPRLRAGNQAAGLLKGTRTRPGEEQRFLVPQPGAWAGGPGSAERHGAEPNRAAALPAKTAEHTTNPCCSLQKMSSHCRSRMER